MRGNPATWKPKDLPEASRESRTGDSIPVKGLGRGMLHARRARVVQSLIFTPPHAHPHIRARAHLLSAVLAFDTWAQAETFETGDDGFQIGPVVEVASATKPAGDEEVTNFEL